MPTIEYFVWRDQMKMARQSGWTITERYFQSFFRGYRNVFFHAYAQGIHPWGYLERQRSDAFIRRMETLIPGIEAPAWAYGQKRTPDFDFVSMHNLTSAYQTVFQEATPKPHYNSTDWNNLTHLFNQRWQGGYYAQRLFFNEQIKGDRYNLGHYWPVDIGLLNSWYANTENSYLWKMQQYNDEEAKQVKHQAEKWLKLLDQHYPEFRTIDCDSVGHKFSEPHYERNVSDIRRSVLSEKWLRAQESGKISTEEADEIKGFFYTDNFGAFFVEGEDGKVHETLLMKKFNEAMNLPSVMNLNRFTGEVPEMQYNRHSEVRNGIDFYAVEKYRKSLVALTSSDQFRKLVENVKGFSLRALVTEEVYNPLFKRELMKKISKNSGSGNIKINDNSKSLVLEILKENGKELDELLQLFYRTREELGLFNRENYERFLHKVRRVVSTFNFVPK